MFLMEGIEGHKVIFLSIPSPSSPSFLLSFIPNPRPTASGSGGAACKHPPAVGEHTCKLPLAGSGAEPQLDRRILEHI